MNVVPIRQSETAEDAFDAFWQAYPRRVAKKEARKAWARIKPELHERILTALEAHKKQEQWLRDGGAYVPYPATWLNGERWEDEITIDCPAGVRWWESEKATEAKARELGMWPPRGGESWAEFRARIRGRLSR